MRHRLSGRQLSRNASHRHALMRNMAASLLRHETIRTTLPKAKELRRVVEPLITLGKSDNMASRRRAFAQLRDVEVVEKLFDVLGPRYQTRPGGYTRILRMMPRPGDAAPMALMQLVDQPEKATQPADPADKPQAKPTKAAKKAKAAKPAAAVSAAEEKRKAKKAAEPESAEDAESKKKAPKKKAAAKKAPKQVQKKARK